MESPRSGEAKPSIAEFRLPAEVGYMTLGKAVAGDVTVEADAVGYYMDMLLLRILMQHRHELMPVKVQRPGAVQGNIDEGAFGESFAGRKTERDMEDGFRHIGTEMPHHIELPDQFIPYAEASIVIDHFGAVPEAHITVGGALSR